MVPSFRAAVVGSESVVFDAKYCGKKLVICVNGYATGFIP